MRDDLINVAGFCKNKNKKILGVIRRRMGFMSTLFAAFIIATATRSTNETSFNLCIPFTCIYQVVECWCGAFEMTYCNVACVAFLNYLSYIPLKTLFSRTAGVCCIDNN